MPDCPSCGDSYVLGASFCTYCGYALSLKPIPPTEPDGSVATCNCGNRDLNPEKARFCRFCGNSLLIREPQSESKAGWHSILALGNNETILDIWEGHEKEMGSSGEGYVEINDKAEGLLFLTNQKIVWLFRVASPRESRFSVGPRILLEKITEISQGIDPTPFVSIADDAGFHLFRLFSREGPNPGFSGSLLLHRKYMTEAEFATFQGLVMKYRAERRLALLELQKKERVQLVLDFSFLKAYMEKGGMVVQKISCANCGASMHLPESGNTVDCPYCRTTHRVEDIFEKIKQLMG